MRIRLTRQQLIYFIIMYISDLVITYFITKKMIANEINKLLGEDVATELIIDIIAIIVIIIAAVFIIVQAVIYKFIVKVIGEKRKFTLGVNLYLIMLSVLPGTIMMFAIVMIYNDITEQSNMWITYITSITSALIYCILLLRFDLIDKKQMYILLSVLLFVNIVFSSLTFIYL
ncbi:hypothetical protein [Staphylococcus kloosii]|uniref:Yip1 domain-containing protein n=1 Tax=Staphylococcus kloosii TaxID=29384 RepID=A0A151A3M7_9STAP|nr:hypothetical protein [Staphylococcus kloosii]KYH13923.1 hypothetical protein A0131_03775 [Staphylococcus kloosii]